LLFLLQVLVPIRDAFDSDSDSDFDSDLTDSGVPAYLIPSGPLMRGRTSRGRRWEGVRSRREDTGPQDFGSGGRPVTIAPAAGLVAGTAYEER
jgi:hypothetical protein